MYRLQIPTCLVLLHFYLKGFFKLKGDSFLRNTYTQTASKHLTQNAFAKFVKLAGFSLFNIWKTCKCYRFYLTLGVSTVETNLDRDRDRPSCRD